MLARNNREEFLVSVPLRGKYCRESKLLIIDILVIKKFPSPCGVNIVGNIYSCVVSFSALIVSVPLRGKYCREFFEMRIFKKGTLHMSFRPLAG